MEGCPGRLPTDSDREIGQTDLVDFSAHPPGGVSIVHRDVNGRVRR